MRIIRGILKSTRFFPPKGFPSRPTTDFAKEGLFNILENQISLVDLEILDLCAGTGNITFEFASREAGHITSVDKNQICSRFIFETVRKMKLENIVSTVKMDLFVYLEKTVHTFDLIFCDAPYDFAFSKQIVDKVVQRSLINQNGLLIIEHGKQTDLSEHPCWIKTRNFGNVYFSFFDTNVTLSVVTQLD